MYDLSVHYMMAQDTKIYTFLYNVRLLPLNLQQIYRYIDNLTLSKYQVACQFPSNGMPAILL